VQTESTATTDKIRCLIADLGTSAFCGIRLQAD